MPENAPPPAAAASAAPGLASNHPLGTLLSCVSRGWWKLFLAIFIAALVLRLAAMATVPLVPEEAYYWMYAQHPSLSYYDHPPMVAWIIRAGTALFGDSEFGVRIAGNLMMLAASLLMIAYGRMWFGLEAALLGAALLHILPLFYGAGFIATMDSSLLCYWMLCMVGVSVALRRGPRRGAWGWYLAGIGLGGAMLSKYTGIFLGAGAFFSVCAYRPWRRHLRSIHPYLAVALAGVIFSPVIIWNAQHDWASFRFQFVGRFQDAAEKHRFQVGEFVNFLLYQLAVATPVLLGAIVLLYARLLRRRRRWLRPRWVLTIMFSLPLLLVMTWKSFTTDININWTLPAYLSLLPALCWLFLERLGALGTFAARQRWGMPFVWTAFICALINLLLMVYLMTLQPRLRLIAGFGPWPKLARIVEAHEDALERQGGREPLIVAGGKYRLASVLAFYRQRIEDPAGQPASAFTTSRWILGRGDHGLGYEYWTTPQAWIGRDCVYVIDDPSEDILADTKPVFDSVEVVEDPALKSLGRYRIAICRGFRPPS